MDEGSSARRDAIADGLRSVRQRIDEARRAAGRTDEVRLVVVTKTFPASDVEHLVALGETDIAENRDQEARAKHDELREQARLVRWHMIGQVQRKKAGSVARWADVVESVDRPELADALDRGAHAAGKILDVLVQVGLDLVHRPERGGAAPDATLGLADQIDSLPSLRLTGVMGVAPYPGDPLAAFESLKRVSDAIRERCPSATTISAGMSDDLEVAVQCGATQVRIGGAVLGHRAYVQ